MGPWLPEGGDVLGPGVGSGDTRHHSAPWEGARWSSPGFHFLVWRAWVGGAGHAGLSQPRSAAPGAAAERGSPARGSTGQRLAGGNGIPAAGAQSGEAAVLCAAQQDRRRQHGVRNGGQRLLGPRRSSASPRASPPPPRSRSLPLHLPNTSSKGASIVLPPRVEG